MCDPVITLADENTAPEFGLICLNIAASGVRCVAVGGSESVLPVVCVEAYKPWPTPWSSDHTIVVADSPGFL